MCTLTFLPNKKEGFILTSSRDEIASRGNTDFPISKRVEEQIITFPQDPLRGGTWLATSENGRVLCLLNGAFKKHHHTPPYAKSRGIVLLDAFKYDKFSDFAANYSLENIEPFTLICAEFGVVTKLFEFRWDGEKRHFLVLDAELPRIWSSSTLYTSEQKEIRESWFEDWFNNNNSGLENAFNFHKEAGQEELSIAIKMKRKVGPETVSISQVSRENSKIIFRHSNLVSKKEKTSKIKSEFLSHV